MDELVGKTLARYKQYQHTDEKGRIFSDWLDISPESYKYIVESFRSEHVNFLEPFTFEDQNVQKTFLTHL